MPKLLKLMLITALAFVSYLIFNVNAANAADYYLSPTGNDSNPGTAAAPWATFNGAFSRMAGGDTLIAKDGTYRQVLGNPPAGTAATYTVVKAEHDGAAIIDPSSLGSGWNWPLYLNGAAYAQIEGFKFKGGLGDGSGAGAATILGSNHIKILRSAFYDTGTRSPDNEGNYSTFILDQSRYILVEDSWAWGYGRYKFEAHESDKVIFRRVVARHDRMDSRFPQALFSIYRSSNTEFQNAVAIDSDQSSYYTGYAGFYGAFYSPNSDSSYPNSGMKILGSIVLNVDGQAVNVPYTLGAHNIKDTVFWHTRGGVSYEWPTGANVLLEHSTIGDIYGARVGDIDPVSGIGAYGFGVGTNARNSLFYRNNVRALHRFGTSDYNNLYNNGENYGAGWAQTPTPAGPYDRYIDPGMRYITRIETSSPLRGAASDGGDIGANIIYRYGRSGSLWGDPGYEELTSERLWPWPNQDRISADMRAYSGPPSGNRGFAGSGTNLTKYIWEYLRNTCPTDICGNLTTPPPSPPANNSPIATVSVNRSSGVAPLSINFTGAGSDSDGTVVSYAWTFGDGTSSALQHPSHTYSNVGVYTARLTVRDDDGATGTASVTITVSATAPNNAPSASIVANPLNGTAPLTVNFTGRGTDSDGTIIRYFWNFGDGTTSNLQNPSHTYNSTAVYNAQLIVTDDDGATGSMTAPITVNSPLPTLDSTPPSTPAGLRATPVSANQVNLAWNAAADNVGVTAYRVYRGGTQVGIAAGNSYSDTGLSANTTYVYAVSAQDAAYNISGQSNQVFATTFTGGAAVDNSLYVSPGGNDSNPGSSALPLRTLQRAADMAMPGYTVFAANGDYAGFRSVRSGTAGSPITFKANGASVVITSPNSQTPDGINIENHNYIIIDGFKVRNMPRSGIRVAEAANVIVRNSETHNNTRFGIFTGFTPRVQILNSSSHHNAEHGIYVSNSRIASDQPVIRGNEVYNNGQNGIQLNGDLGVGGDGMINGAVVEKNIVHNNSQKGLSIISASGSQIKNNIVYNNRAGGTGAAGIHIVEQPGTGKYSNNNTVVNNTVVEPSMAAIRVNARNRGNVVFNNILVSYLAVAFEGSGNSADSSSNIRRGSTAGIFADADSGDYHLVSGSPAVNKGRSSFAGRGAPRVDIAETARPQGRAWDSGAYERR